MDEMFKKQCEESGIDYAEFPYSFPDETAFPQTDIIEAMMWILKKRQDKMLAEAVA